MHRLAQESSALSTAHPHKFFDLKDRSSKQVKSLNQNYANLLGEESQITVFLGPHIASDYQSAVVGDGSKALNLKGDNSFYE